MKYDKIWEIYQKSSAYHEDQVHRSTEIQRLEKIDHGRPEDILDLKYEHRELLKRLRNNEYSGESLWAACQQSQSQVVGQMLRKLFILLPLIQTQDRVTEKVQCAIKRLVEACQTLYGQIPRGPPFQIYVPQTLIGVIRKIIDAKGDDEVHEWRWTNVIAACEVYILERQPEDTPAQQAIRLAYYALSDSDAEPNAELIATKSARMEEVVN